MVLWGVSIVEIASSYSHQRSRSCSYYCKWTQAISKAQTSSHCQEDRSSSQRIQGHQENCGGGNPYQEKAWCKYARLHVPFVLDPTSVIIVSLPHPGYFDLFDEAALLVMGTVTAFLGKRGCQYRLYNTRFQRPNKFFRSLFWARSRFGINIRPCQNSALLMASLPTSVWTTNTHSGPILVQLK